MLNPEDTETVLAAALREVHGVDARLETWSADPLKRGKRRVMRYDLQARVTRGADPQRYQWVGKLYERDEDARAVAAILGKLVAVHWGPRGGFVVPRVVAYHASRRLLLLTYESGESVTKAIARDAPAALEGVGRALAVLHAAPITGVAITGPEAVMGDVSQRIADLSARFPSDAPALERVLTALSREAPALATLSFLHGDLGLAQLLWSAGRVVVLDFDTCTRGDPALDLGNLLIQLRRLTLRKPGKLPGFEGLRAGLLDAYRRWGRHDPGLGRRVVWYEQVALVRKTHSLAFDTTRHPEAEVIQERHAEAMRLLEVCGRYAP
jgi:aminoglycoside phosphotransferase (APT) family kinase protein